MWIVISRARLKRDSTREETRFGLSEKWTSLFKSAGVSVQSTAGSRGVRISGQTMDRPCSEAQCKSSGYPLQSSISPSIPLPRVTVCHHVSNGLYHLIARSPALSSVPSYLRPGPRNIGWQSNIPKRNTRRTLDDQKALSASHLASVTSWCRFLCQYRFFCGCSRCYYSNWIICFWMGREGKGLSPLRCFRTWLRPNAHRGL